MAWVIKRRSSGGKLARYWTGVIMVLDETGRLRQVARTTKLTHRAKALALAREWEIVVEVLCFISPQQQIITGTSASSGTADIRRSFMK